MNAYFRPLHALLERLPACGRRRSRVPIEKIVPHGRPTALRILAHASDGEAIYFARVDSPDLYIAAGRFADGAACIAIRTPSAAPIPIPSRSSSSRKLVSAPPLRYPTTVGLSWEIDATAITSRKITPPSAPPIRTASPTTRAFETRLPCRACSRKASAT